jgi:hypothetical protein
VMQWFFVAACTCVNTQRSQTAPATGHPSKTPMPAQSAMHTPWAHPYLPVLSPAPAVPPGVQVPARPRQPPIPWLHPGLRQAAQQLPHQQGHTPAQSHVHTRQAQPPGVPAARDGQAHAVADRRSSSGSGGSSRRDNGQRGASSSRGQRQVGQQQRAGSTLHGWLSQPQGGGREPRDS